jgi:beta-glucosidase
MVLLRNAGRQELLEPDTFLWCTGIEDTFITSPWPKTGRTLDEYELTGHYERCEDDIGLMAELGVRCARYGIPWHRINPQRGKWEWDWTDRAIERFSALKIQPIIDLVHYGLPPWIEQAYLNPDYPEYVSEYAHRVAERYKGAVTAYTPLNEPRITAWYCGRLGWWPPFQRSWRGFAQVMQGVCRGIVRTVEALRAVDPDILIAHVDATDLYEAASPDLEKEAQFRQEIVFLALDLVSGRLTASHPLYAWLTRQGYSDEVFHWFHQHRVDLPLIGINLYPMFTQKLLTRAGGGRLRIKMPYADATLIEKLAELYWKRYQAPLFISETASVGSVKKRMAWLEDSVEAVRKTRARNIPLVGYTWWPMFALVTWGYRQGTKPPPFYLKQMGLWDLTDDLSRVRTALVDRFKECVRDSTHVVGKLANAARDRATALHPAEVSNIH